MDAASPSTPKEDAGRDGSTPDSATVDARIPEAEPTAITTGAASDRVKAGEPIEITCAVRAQGRVAIEPSALDEAPTLSASPGLTVTELSPGVFRVEGTAAGTYELQCTLGELDDGAPITIDIVPGDPARIDTHLEDDELAPEDDLTVSCEVEDAYGNIIEDAETEAQLHDASHAFLGAGTAPRAPTQAGDYFVACAAGAELIDASPAPLRVRPGLPYDWEVSLPSERCRPQGVPLPISHRVVDAWGNTVSPAEYGLTLSAIGGEAMLASNALVLVGEGEVEVTLALDPSVERDEDSVIAPVRALLHADSTPPAIVVTSPERASMLEQSEPVVSVTGSASDESGLSSLEIDGQAIALEPGATEHAFATEQASVWGLNVIAGHAEDACGNRRELAHAYLRSSAYLEAATQSSASASVPAGLVVRLNQPVLDDLDRNDLDDLASIAETILQAVDLNALFPPGRLLSRELLRSTDDCTFCQFWADTSHYVRRHDSANTRVEWDGPHVNFIRAEDDGLVLSAQLERVDIPLQAQGCTRECACGLPATQCVSPSGWAGASRISAVARLVVSAGDGQVSVNVHSMTLSTTDMYMDIDCSAVDFLCDVLADAVVPLISGDIEGLLADLIRQSITALVEDFLEGFTLAESITVPAPLAVPLNLESGFDSVDFDGPAGTGNGELAMFVQAFPNERGPTVPETARGSIVRGGDVPSFSPAGYTIGFALKDDVLNQLLWSVWYSGGLVLDAAELRELAGDAALLGAELSLSAALPPVIMPGDEAESVLLGLGGARIEGTFDLATAHGGQESGVVHFTADVAALARATISLEPGSNKVKLTALDDHDPELYIEMIAIDQPAHDADVRELLGRVLRSLVAEMVDRIAGGFPLPKLDLAPYADDTLELTGGTLQRPAPTNQCIAGEGDPSSSLLCITGALQ